MRQDMRNIGCNFLGGSRHARGTALARPVPHSTGIATHRVAVRLSFGEAVSALITRDISQPVSDSEAVLPVHVNLNGSVGVCIESQSRSVIEMQKEGGEEAL